MATATKSKSKTKRPTVRVVVSTFDHSAREIYRSIRQSTLSNFRQITSADYFPHGGTPLLDATAQFITHLSTLSKKGSVVIGCLADESGSMISNRQSVIDGINEFVNGMIGIEVDPDSDGRVLAVILTDGYENRSTETSNEDLQKMISEKESNGWTFIYLGANQDAWAIGGNMGFAHNTNFASSPVGTESAMKYAGSTSANYLRSTVNTVDNLSSGTISEHGGFSTENISPTQNPAPPSSGYDVKSAIDKAKGS